VTEPEPHVEPTDEPYRRRIELRPSEGVVEAAMEDFMHHFGLRLHHDGTVITAVEVAPERVPWSTCPEGAAGLLRLEGVPLADVADLDRWMGGRTAQCVHTTDLAVVAAAAARRGPDRTYEIRVTGSFRERRRATMLRDGEPWADWTIEGQRVLDDPRFTGLTLDRRGFSTWVQAHFGATGDDAEGAFVLRRASIIAMGRGLDMDEWTHPDDARPADESCHTYRRDVVSVSLRNVGSGRANDADGEGVPIPERHNWSVRTSVPRT
jgi:hypothetical protein